MLSKEILKSIKSLKPTFFKNTVKDIFSFKELEKLLNLRPFVNNSRFTPVHSKPYAWKASGWLSDKNSFPPFVIKDILKTSVCYLRDASRANKKLNTICKEIEEATHWPTDAHIYFSVKETEKLSAEKPLNEKQKELLAEQEKSKAERLKAGITGEGKSMYRS